MGYDSFPERLAASELGLMVEAGHHGCRAGVGHGNRSFALGRRPHRDDQPGKLADLLVIDGDPLSDIGTLLDPNRIHLVMQSGEPVAGKALEPGLRPSRS
jgi:hypothetical protein